MRKSFATVLPFLLAFHAGCSSEEHSAREGISDIDQDCMLLAEDGSFARDYWDQFDLEADNFAASSNVQERARVELEKCFQTSGLSYRLGQRFSDLQYAVLMQSKSGEILRQEGFDLSIVDSLIEQAIENSNFDPQSLFEAHGKKFDRLLRQTGERSDLDYPELSRLLGMYVGASLQREDAYIALSQ